MLLLKKIIEKLVQLFPHVNSSSPLAWIEGFAIFIAVMVCSSVAAGNDYQKEKQFKKLKEVAGSKKEVRVRQYLVLMSVLGQCLERWHFDWYP